MNATRAGSLVLVAPGFADAPPSPGGSTRAPKRGP